MTMFRDHIAFKILHNYDFGEMAETGEVFYPNSGNRTQLVDNEILEEKSVSKWKAFIRKASNQTFKLYKKKYLKKEINQISGEASIKKYEECYFKSENSQYILYGIFIKDEYDSHCDFIGVFDTTTEEYAVVGCNGEHPFIITNDFAYDNSDGSGPTIRPKIKDADTLMKAFVKYYRRFCRDEYH